MAAARLALLIFVASVGVALCSPGAAEAVQSKMVAEKLVSFRMQRHVRAEPSPNPLLVARRRSPSGARSEQVTPVAAGKAGDYSISVSIGSPPKEFKVQVDTKSSYFAIPDIDCVSCATTDRYDSNTSVTSRTVNCTGSCQFCKNLTDCGLSIFYSDDRRIKGLLYTDVVTMGSLSVNASFVSFTFETPNFESRVFDGVLGLAYESLAVSPGVTLLTSLVRANLVEDVFSMCLGIYGGYIAFGGADSDLYLASQLIETPIQQQTRYVIRTTNLKISGTSISLRTEAFNPTTIDSTTQHILLLPASTWDSFYDVFVVKYCAGANPLFGVCSQDPSQTIWEGACYDFTDDQLNSYPVLEVSFEPVSGSADSAHVSLSPRDYLVEDENGFRCLDILPHNNPQIGGMLLGARWMQKYYTIFNRKEKKIGFAPAENCTGARYVLEMVAGNQQAGTVSTVLPVQLTVRVFDLATKANVSNALVTWTVVKGKGAVSASQTRTDKDGRAAVTLTLGEFPATNMVVATVDLALNSPLPFVAEGQQSIVITVFGFLTAAFVAFLLTLVFFLNRRIERERSVAAGSTLSMLIDSNRKNAFAAERLKTGLNNSALLSPDRRPPASPDAADTYADKLT